MALIIINVGLILEDDALLTASTGQRCLIVVQIGQTAVPLHHEPSDMAK